MRFRLPHAARVAAGCLMAALAHAQTPPMHPLMHECARVADDTARLACYDRSFGRPVAVPVNTAPPAGPAVPPEAAPASPAVPALPPEPVPEPAEFGFKRGEIERAQAARSEDEDASSQSLAATVTSVESRRGQFTATLDNGQVWSQIEINPKVYLQAGDSVTVRRAVFGSYLLTGPQGVATRVKRLR